MVDAPEKAPAAPPAPTPAPAAAKKERIDEHLPPKLVEALKTASYKPSDILAVKSYEEQQLWRVVTSDGQKHEYSYAGVWLTKPKPKAEKKAAKPE